MINFKDIITTPGDNLTMSYADHAQQVECESDFDQAIKDSLSRGTWPAVVRSARDGMKTANLLIVAERFRREGGWVVITQGVGDGVRALIERPNVTP